jgi:hypothetical protein
MSPLTTAAPRDWRSSTVASPMPDEPPRKMLVQCTNNLFVPKYTCNDSNLALEPGQVCVVDLKVCHIEGFEL